MVGWSGGSLACLASGEDGRAMADGEDGRATRHGGMAAWRHGRLRASARALILPSRSHRRSLPRAAPQAPSGPPFAGDIIPTLFIIIIIRSPRSDHDNAHARASPPAPAPAPPPSLWSLEGTRSSSATPAHHRSPSLASTAAPARHAATTRATARQSCCRRSATVAIRSACFSLSCLTASACRALLPQPASACPCLPLPASACLGTLERAVQPFLSSGENSPDPLAQLLSAPLAGTVVQRP